MNVAIRKATIMDSEVISRIHASSWKAAYKGLVPQRYLDELKYDYWEITKRLKCFFDSFYTPQSGAYPLQG